MTLYEAVAPALTASFDRLSGPRYNVVRLEDPTLATCDAQILKQMDEAASAIVEGGHAVRSAASPVDLGTLFENQQRVMQYEASRIYRGLLDLPKDSVGPKLREMIGIGLALSDSGYRDDRMRLADGLASTGDPRYIAPWTALSGPIVTQPIGRAANGLPIGMLICGRPGADRALARVACALDGVQGTDHC